MRVAQKMRWNKILLKVKKVSGNTPQSEHCVKNTTQKVTAAGKKGAAKTNYKNCGRKKALTPEASKKVFVFAKTWKKKASCTCPMHRPRAAFRQLILQWAASGIYSSRRPSCTYWSQHWGTRLRYSLSDYHNPGSPMLVLVIQTNKGI